MKALGFGRKRRDEDVPAAVADVEAKFFSSEKELTVDQESLKKDAESGLKEMEEIILSETDPNAEPPQYPETKELEGVTLFQIIRNINLIKVSFK